MRNSNKWTQDELDVLQQNKALPIRQLETLLLNHPRKSIQTERFMIGYRKSRADMAGALSFNYDLTAPESAYTAGILDGEGTVSIMKQMDKRSRNAILILTSRIGIVNTNQDLIAWLNRKLSFSGITPKEPRKKHRLECWEGYILGYRCCPLLRTLLPFLIVKKELAELLCEFIESRCKREEVYGEGYSTRELDIFKSIRELNAKGVNRPFA